MPKLRSLLFAALALLLYLPAAQAFELGIIGFQFSSETHARVANAAAAAARQLGWNVTLLNSEGSLPKHAEQFEALITKKVDAIIIAMGKPVEADAQFQAAKDAGIPVITVQSGSSPHALFDIETNEYKVGADGTLYLLGVMGYQGNLLSVRFDANIASRIRDKMLDVALSENGGVHEVAKFTMARTQSWRDDVRSGVQALLLQNQGKVQGVWASFDGQAYIVDDLLKAQGVKKGQIPLVSMDGGPESFRRIADPDSTLIATVNVRGNGAPGGAGDRRHRSEKATEIRCDRWPLSVHGCDAGGPGQRQAVPELTTGAPAVPLFSLRGISQRYGAVAALLEVDLDIAAGEVVAICGDNGAGKSSLIRIMSGAAEPSSGSMALRGATVRFQVPHDALAQGIATIYQDLALAPRLSIMANVFMGAELTRPLLLPFLRVLDKSRMAREARDYLARLSVRIADTTRPVERLSGGQRQAVAISRALRWNAEIIIMDEPTASLGVRETAQVLDLIRHLKAEGRTVVLVSHNMRDVVAVATRIVILRSGRKTHDRPTAGLSADDIGHMIVNGNNEAG